MHEYRPEQEAIIGESPAFLEILSQTSRAARHDRPVLIIGERGTGKELIAARLHFLSPRWEQPFLQVNCAALPENLLESELFGHESGAFTGATARRAGRFEEAHGGTIFLDEIATTSLRAQEKILRVTEYGVYQRLGSNRTLHADVRMVGATNIDLPTAADRGEFRRDLLDRLAMEVITLPPLRARRQDILILAGHFARRVVQERGWQNFAGFSKDMQELLLAHDWPGNIRELRNTVERAVYHSEEEQDVIETMTLDPFVSPYRPVGVKQKAGATHVMKQEALPPASFSPVNYMEVVAETERKILEAALKSCRYNQRDTAAALSLSYHQLRHQMKKHGLNN